MSGSLPDFAIQAGKPDLRINIYTKTGLVFGFSKNQSLVAVIPGQKAPRTFPGLENAEDVTRAK